MVLDSAVQLALIVAVPAVISPVMLQLLSSWAANRAKKVEAEIRKAEREEDYARQDKVAALAAVANKVVAEAAVVTNTKLDQIHVLVNSNMTEAMQAELNATKREVAMMHEVIELKKASGKDPLPMALKAVEATDKRIAELEAAIAERNRVATAIAPKN